MRIYSLDSMQMYCNLLQTTLHYIGNLFYFLSIANAILKFSTQNSPIINNHSQCMAHVFAALAWGPKVGIGTTTMLEILELVLVLLN